MESGLQVIQSRAEGLGRFMASYARLARLPAPDLGPVKVAPLVARVAALETRLPVEVLGGPDLEIQADIDFNVRERKLLYTGFAFLYNYQCIDFKADVKVFYFRETPDVQFRISFELGNIGRTIDFFGGLEF